jgi:DNA invertase Pin-like site-specific DNA recombinase
MKNSAENPKVTAAHLGRKAFVYLRQSSLRQVRENQESQRLQYGMADRARELGWKNVDVLDMDLGRSAAVGAARREGFERLIASVAMGQVGIVLSREASRLSRTDKDWCQLLEVCGVFGTLIADAERVYDLKQIDDQLMLGIKGMLSVVELSTIKIRLLQGMEAKAARGELFRMVPVGYVREGKDKVMKDPDRRVQEAMELLFRKFREIRSARQTFLWFHAEGVELPVNRWEGGKARTTWQVPTHAFIANALRNPFYAGAYFWGRRPTEITLVEGRLQRRSGRERRPGECRVFLWGHHEGYIDRETFEENVRIMRGNNLKVEHDESVAPIRAGQGLLVGLLRCGRCGRKLHVRYWGKSGTAARYLCDGDYAMGGKYCLGFGGSTVDRRFGQELVKVLSPLGTRAAVEAIERRRSGERDRREAMARQLEQVEYEAKRAFEQYDEVDARNRLVAAELEGRWNDRLERMERLRVELAELDAEIRPLSEEEQARILELGERFSEVWESGACPVELRKKIIRTVVEEVIVNLDEAGKRLHLVIHWKGGSHTAFEMEKPRSGVGRQTSLEDLEVIRRMAARYGDDEIARVLTKLGRRTATGKRWNEERVAATRKKYSIEGRKRSTPDPDVLTLARAAEYGGVSDTTIKRLVEAGLLKKEQAAPWAPWEIRRSDLEVEPVRSILKRLRETGKLVLGGDSSAAQGRLFVQAQ